MKIEGYSPNPIYHVLYRNDTYENAKCSPNLPSFKDAIKYAQNNHGKSFTFIFISKHLMKMNYFLVIKKYNNFKIELRAPDCKNSNEELLIENLILNGISNDEFLNCEYIDLHGKTHLF